VNLRDLDCRNIDDLATLDLRNGNNTNLLLQFYDNPSLKCIYVDDKEYSNSNWDNDQPLITYFVESEIECETLSLQEFKTTIFSFFPNPVTNKLTIKTKVNIRQIIIYNALGKELFKTNNVVIDVSRLAAGMYFVSVQGEKSTVTIRSFIKN